MPLVFSASQQLTLAIAANAERLPTYLGDERRVVEALLDPRQLEPLGPSRYRYTVTRLQVFQLQIQPIVELQVQHVGPRLELSAVDCQLEGLGLVEDFRLTLDSWLEPRPQGLEGEASLAVSVSRPALLKLIPPKVLEATGRTVLSGILLGIRSRVGDQLVGDFQHWCDAHPES
ncbi:MAG: DUF1997 domain-containing protein [Synechococcaceae cyanobacterium]|nr:DUF1997 domain-containing protein [Synechococcaceae cyanobacterium]